MATMIRRVLIANRGEIAIRIARTARYLGISPVGIASEADRFALHRDALDASLVIGPSPARESYLDLDRVLQAARTLGADAVHPGYGFLSEQAAFAQAVIDAGLTFIGPPAYALRDAGDKRRAKELARAAGVVTLDGYDGNEQSEEALLEHARLLVMPIMIKASNGGGGRGQRIVRTIEEFPEALRAARREAQSAFGDASMLLERFVDEPRHIEIQIAADAYGGCIALGDRDCSLQRRRQKVIEEAPAAELPDERRAEITSAAISVARACGYRNLGTVEFLVAKDGTFAFLEMNARLQVEHPVTELVSGLDLVGLQFHIAQGARLSELVPSLQTRGHAIEARVCAEDPNNGLLPVSGRITECTFPRTPGIRVDTGVEAGSSVALEYDSMIAKIIAHAPTRGEAITRLDAALAETRIVGIPTNIPMLRALLGDPVVREGRATTQYIDDASAANPARQTMMQVELLSAAGIEAGFTATLRSGRHETTAHTPVTNERDILSAAMTALLTVGVSRRLAPFAIPLTFRVAGISVNARLTPTSPTATANAKTFSFAVTGNYAHTTSSEQNVATQALPTPFHHDIAASDTSNDVASNGSETRAESRHLPFDSVSFEVDEPVNGIRRFTCSTSRGDDTAYTTGKLVASSGGARFRVHRDPHIFEVRLLAAPSTDEDFIARHANQSGGATTVLSPMPGRLLRLLVSDGDVVAEHALLAILEAMKMEHRIEAPRAGIIRRVTAREGSVLAAAAHMLDIEAAL